MDQISQILLRHWKPLLGLNVALMAIAYVNAQSVEDVWIAEAELILPNRTSDLTADLGTLGDIRGGDGVTFSQQVDSRDILTSILMSKDTLARVREVDPEKEQYSRLNAYRGLFEASPDSESTVISISVEGSSPEWAQTRADAWIDAFQNRLNDLRQEDAGQRTQFFTQELTQARQDLQAAQQALVEFQQATNLVSSDTQTQEIVQAINTLTTNQAQVVAQAQASQTQVNDLSSRIGLTLDQAVRSLRLGENQDYQFVRQELAELETALVEVQAQFTDEHPTVQQLLDQREGLRSQVARYIAQASANVAGVDTTIGENSATMIQELILTASEAQALSQQAQQLQNQVNRLSSQLRTLPAAQARLAELQRQYNIVEGVYNGLVAKEQEAKVNAFSTYPSVQILDQPSVDSKPSGPGRRPIALGAILASLFGSAALLAFLESRSPLMRDSDFQGLDIPVLGRVQPPRQSELQVNGKSNVTRDFQRLASTVSMIDLPNRRLMISSALSTEGKTTVTLGLAIALSDLGFRVLLVDGDFQTSRLRQRFDFAQPMHSEKPSQLKSIRPGLDLLVIESQPDKTFEFIARGGLEQCLQSAQTTHDYDYVLIDSAPVSLSSETTLMAQAVSNVMLVVCPNDSHRESFNDSVQQLMRHKARIVGLVFNETKDADEANYSRQISIGRHN
ncbi:MAG: GumC family protein [Elainellaceae cyanobacterium]